ncbi:MAG: hypothetical protein AAGI08_00540 [Bacteroidota bacterium]
MRTPLSEVTLRVDPVTAQAYRDASDEEKALARSAFESVLAQGRASAREAAANSLMAVMDEMGKEAQTRGLTEDKLRDLLQEIDEERDAELRSSTRRKDVSSGAGETS